MAIAKLNKTFKNKGEPGYEENPINKTLLQDMCDKTDEVIDKIPLKNTITAGDFNNAIETGFYLMKNFCSNSPSIATEHWYLIVIQFSTSYILQIAFALFAGDKQLYMRKKLNNSWSDWNFPSKAGTYLLSGGINRLEGDIDLNDSINNYDYLVCAVGSVGDGSYVHTRMMPFATQYANGQNTRGLWRINTDIPVALTVNGSISFEIVTERKFRIKTNVSNTPVRAIYGIKLY